MGTETIALKVKLNLIGQKKKPALMSLVRRRYTSGSRFRFDRSKDGNGPVTKRKNVTGVSRVAWVADFIHVIRKTKEIILRDSWPEGFAWIISRYSWFYHYLKFIFRRKFSVWLGRWESSIEGDLGMRFAIWSLELAIRDFTALFTHCLFILVTLF